ncbi:MAG: HAMP domain-containing histidine kinase [Dehalococcoidia bacterium]|nr:HAMP domain-containing histidine kinase [Dehalococcoidia bacterium]
MPRSLRSKLILAFAAVIFICLFSAGTGFVIFFRNHETEREREKVGRLAQPLALRVTYLEWLGLMPEQMRPALDDYAAGLDVRILLVDKVTSTVLVDTEQSLEGQTVPALGSSGGTERVGPIWVRQVRFSDDGQNLLLYTPLDTVSGQGTSPEMFSRYRSVVAVPEANITSAWLDILPRVGIAGGIALFISVAIAFVFSRSISGPLGQITRASEEMARGNYNQQIDVRGRDEVARLATAFNAMALEVNRSQATLRQFLADASHELRTPLTSIQGFSQAMAEGAIEDPADMAESARIINEETQRMRALVDDLLYLSQIEAGQVTLQPEALKLDNLLQACVERFQRRAQEKDLQIRSDVPALPQVQGDVRRLERVFSNLLDNAIRHTPKDGTITIAAHAVNGNVWVGVHNTGSFIPPEHLPHVCERFYQVNKSTNDEGHTGLGLAIASEVVHAHGGTISAQSSQRDGTEFSVTLPLRKPPLPTSASLA